jgi:hypothetical protein
MIPFQGVPEERENFYRQFIVKNGKRIRSKEYREGGVLPHRNFNDNSPV